MTTAKKQNTSHFNIPSYQTLSLNEKKQIKSAFLNKIKHFSNIMNVTFNRIAIKNQHTRWGSCSSLGNLNFNYRLYFLPEKYMDYVIVHELAHRLQMNHSKEFWNIVAKYCPDWKALRKELKSIRITDY